MLTGAGYTTNATKVTFEAIDLNGLPYILTVTPDSVAADGASPVFTVPAEVADWHRFHSQWRVASWSKLRRASPASTEAPVASLPSTVLASLKAGRTVRFGNTNVVDRGIAPDDGIDVRFGILAMAD